MRLIVLVTSLLAVSMQARAESTAPWCGEFLPMITEAWIGAPHRRVHFAPKYCNKIMVDGVIETIPPAIAVLSGGISTDVTNTCIDTVCGQPLKPNMLYRAYVFKQKGKKGKLKINFSVSEHKEGKHGNEVNADDPSQSFIGLVATEESGRICGGMNLCLLSWFYRGHTGLGNWIGPDYGRPTAEVCATALQPVPSASVKILVFGINSTFRQGYTVPNFLTTGTLTNSMPGKTSEAAIAIEWGGTPVTFASGKPGTVHWAHFMSSNVPPGTALSFSSDGTLPSPLATGKTYYVRDAQDESNFTLAETPNGPPIALSGDGRGKHIAIVNARRAGPRTTVVSHGDGDAGPLNAVAVGALGAEEGWVKAFLMLGAPNGGCARVPDGMIFTSPHHS